MCLYVYIVSAGGISWCFIFLILLSLLCSLIAPKWFVRIVLCGVSITLCMVPPDTHRKKCQEIYHGGFLTAFSSESMSF